MPALRVPLRRRQPSPCLTVLEVRFCVTCFESYCSPCADDVGAWLRIGFDTKLGTFQSTGMFLNRILDKELVSLKIDETHACSRCSYKCTSLFAAVCGLVLFPVGFVLDRAFSRLCSCQRDASGPFGGQFESARSARARGLGAESRVPQVCARIWGSSCCCWFLVVFLVVFVLATDSAFVSVAADFVVGLADPDHPVRLYRFDGSAALDAANLRRRSRFGV